MTREKKLLLTTYTSVVFQLVSIVSGFILPRFYLSFWGSEVNGLVSSVSQFLSLISFLDMGVGQVVQSALYKPLSDKDYTKASEVLSSGRKFFKKLALLFLVYTAVLAFVYPALTDSFFDYWYILALIFILSINSFAQYYFGVNYQILLNSDQRGYVQYSINSVTVLMNLGVSVVLLRAGCGLLTVKFVTVLIFLLRPFLMWLYINKNYPGVDFDVDLKYEPLKQKWDGFAQHAASVVLSNTDIVVLTIFSTLANVSVYSVYNLVITGIKQIFTSATTGIQAVLGDLWVNEKIHELKSFFCKIEWMIHTTVTIIFGCTAALIVPFVTVYTSGIMDADYIQPLFGILIVAAHACHCMRLPYNIMVMAGGHFRQTQICHIVSAIINVVISVISVWRYGLIGVAIGTLVAMLYQTVWLAYYLSKHFFYHSLKGFWKQVIVDVLIAISSFLISSRFEFVNISYLSWIILAIKKMSVFLIVSFVVNSVFYKNYLFGLLKRKRNK